MKEDLVGQIFERLTVEKFYGKDRLNRSIWTCRCSCGTIKHIRQADFKNGNTKSCGCMQKERRFFVTMDLSNQVFGRLKVLSRTAITGEWLCLCSCGNYVNVHARKLINGDNKSCGCLLKEKSKDLAGKRFGKLVAQSKTYSHKYRSNVWLCICDCGNTKIIATSQLTSGRSTHCGCSPKKNPGNIVNIVGITINNWKVLEKLENNKYVCEHTCGKSRTIPREGIKRYKCTCEIEKAKTGRRKDTRNRLSNKYVSKKFGKLTVEKLIKFNYSNSMWECRCDCGAIIRVSTSVLKKGNHCCGDINARVRPGDTFGRLTVLSKCAKRYYKNKNIKQKLTYWYCLCNCGKIKIVPECNLPNSNTRSCGCLRFEISYQSIYVSKKKEHDRLRSTRGYKLWRNKVVRRDDCMCQICGNTSSTLEVHHLLSHSRYKHNRRDLNNGITLCIDCHQEFHTKYTSTEFTVQNFVDFLRTKKFEGTEITDQPSYTLC